jgi:hypothetical protein
METKLYYKLIWLEIRIAHQISVEISDIEFHQNLSNGLCVTEKSLFMAEWELGFIMD